MNDDNSTIRTIIMPPPSIPNSKHKSEPPPPKERQKRVITTTKNWDFDTSELTFENQQCLVKDIQQYILVSNNVRNNVINSNKLRTIIRQLNDKLQGYKSQDINKHLYSDTLFIKLSELIDLFVSTSLLCFYCKQPVRMLYEEVRDPKQWTLERIDNKFGHNNDNVTIACLHCNIQRRTMYHERFIFTKQVAPNIIKINSNSNNPDPDPLPHL